MSSEIALTEHFNHLILSLCPWALEGTSCLASVVASHHLFSGNCWHFRVISSKKLVGLGFFCFFCILNKALLCDADLLFTSAIMRCPAQTDREPFMSTSFCQSSVTLLLLHFYTFIIRSGQDTWMCPNLKNVWLPERVAPNTAQTCFRPLFKPRSEMASVSSSPLVGAPLVQLHRGAWAAIYLLASFFFSHIAVR